MKRRRRSIPGRRNFMSKGRRQKKKKKIRQVWETSSREVSRE